MLQILMPMAGSGKRLADAGYTQPKPLIDVCGRPMAKRVIENVRPKQPHHWVFVPQKFHGMYGNFVEWLGTAGDWVHWPIHDSTDGAARTCLSAKSAIEPNDPLLICNCDQLVIGGIEPLLDNDADAAVLTMDAEGGKWSYIVPGINMGVLRVVEKPTAWQNYQRATTGHYWFRRAGDFFAAAECMIALDDRTNGEFYVAPTLNYLIAAGKSVLEVRTEDYGGRFHGTGTPDDLKAFLAHPDAATLET